LPATAKLSNGKAAATSQANDQALSVIIVTYNSAEVLPGLLDSLPCGLAGIDDYEVLIVDNDSGDGSVEIGRNHPVGAKAILAGRNAGYAGGINVACEHIDPRRTILILNPDIRLQPGCARALLERLAKPSVGIAVPRILHTDRTVAHSLRREPSIFTVWSDAILGTRLAAKLGIGEIVADAALYERGGTAEWATGAVLAVSAETRDAIGPWDESFFLYSEEVDYMERVRRSGRSMDYEVTATAVHIGGDYHENTFLSALMTANRIRYFRRHHGALATLIFRVGIIFGETLRYTMGPGHRAALRAALSASSLHPITGLR
jgi:N-acetylglucosaminyl-diphospho-decaprenol L-rhamnosyltransferase